MKSWKTTSAGLLLIAGALVSLFFHRHALTETSVMAAVTAIVSGLGLLFARDNNVTSEESGAHNLYRKERRRRLPCVLIPLALAALLTLPACKIPQTITVSPAGGQPVSFTTGKDAKTTAKAAGLAAAAWYLRILTTPPAPAKPDK